jgi:hypothetical protein
MKSDFKWLIYQKFHMAFCKVLYSEMLHMKCERFPNKAQITLAIVDCD